MILHPDGRIEGTPEELQQFEELRKATPVTVPLPVIEPIPQRWWRPGTAPEPFVIPTGPGVANQEWRIDCGSATYKPNPNIIAMN